MNNVAYWVLIVFAAAVYAFIIVKVADADTSRTERTFLTVLLLMGFFIYAAVLKAVMIA